ncbi:MAG: hypothetical protein M1816_005384 [Peltula sp. TS41687]|nr:MAG: hypothetical protein M1816_005384 [Peltula sp. TS41687]
MPQPGKIDLEPYKADILRLHEHGNSLEGICSILAQTHAIHKPSTRTLQRRLQHWGVTSSTTATSRAAVQAHTHTHPAPHDYTESTPSTNNPTTMQASPPAANSSSSLDLTVVAAIETAVKDHDSAMEVVRIAMNSWKRIEVDAAVRAAVKESGAAMEAVKAAVDRWRELEEKQPPTMEEQRRRQEADELARKYAPKNFPEGQAAPKVASTTRPEVTPRSLFPISTAKKTMPVSKGSPAAAYAPSLNPTPTNVSSSARRVPLPPLPPLPSPPVVVSPSIARTSPGEDGDHSTDLRQQQQQQQQNQPIISDRSRGHEEGTTTTTTKGRDSELTSNKKRKLNRSKDYTIDTSTWYAEGLPE